MTRQLTALAGLGSLCYFDLYLIGIHKIFRCYTEPAACHLFDGTPDPVTILKRVKSFRIFTSFTSITSPANTVHGFSC